MKKKLKMVGKMYAILTCFLFGTALVQGREGNLRQLETFAKLSEALPTGVTNFASLVPVFDFDTDGCLPAAAVSRTGLQNPGVSIGGSITSGCRNDAFLTYSNTYHRKSCATSSGVEYCAHMFGLYFEKDQWAYFFGGHTNDWEHVIIWTTAGAITHASYSAHGDYFIDVVGNLDKQNGLIKFVYHKDGVQTHCMRFAKSGEVAENSYGTFVTMTIVSWETMVGDGVTNAQMKSKLNTFDFGSAHLDLRDDRFLGQVNENKPAEYPTFS